MIVLDSGALIGVERKNDRVMALLKQAVKRRTPIVVPATVLSQVWRNSPRQHGLRQLMKDDVVTVTDLNIAGALAVGALLATTGTADVVDAHVVVLARTLHAELVVTSDPNDLHTLAPKLHLVTV